jgi:hypothetical protein
VIIKKSLNLIFFLLPTSQLGHYIYTSSCIYSNINQLYLEWRCFMLQQRQLIHSFWNALRIRRKINQLHQSSCYTSSIYYTTQNNPNNGLMFPWRTHQSQLYPRNCRSKVGLTQKNYIRILRKKIFSLFLAYFSIFTTKM